MKQLKFISFFFLMFMVMVSFSECSSTKAIQEKAPIVFGEVYCQPWTAGIIGGGSGINLFIPIKSAIPESITLDSVYFRGKSAKLELIENGTPMYVGRFKTMFNQKQDIVMSSDSKEEYGNQLPKIEPKIPFELIDNECMISYKTGKKTQYYRIRNIVEHHSLNYPSAPPNRQ